jgi:phenylacetate-CoA ligase
VLKQLPISQILGAMFPALPDMHAGIQLSLQYQFESSQWWSAETLRLHQYRELASLLRHATSCVPYYQQLFDSHGLRLPEHLTDEFLQKIPISSRSMVQNAGNALEAQQLPAGHGAVQFSTTSGSTGRPVRFARTGLTHTLWLAFALREHLWHERDFSGKLCAIRWFPRGTAEAPEGIHYETWGSIVAPVFATGKSASLNVVSSIEDQLNWITRERPDYLVSFPSNLVALAQHVISAAPPVPAMRQIRTIGESLSDTQRALIEQALQTRVVDVYSCEEAGYLAMQCPESGHYHVQSENVMLEIVDEAGRPCAPGQVGQVLITTLHNYATPLIRYEIGDMAEFGEPCDCGRGLPVIRRIHGRKRNRLVLPSGDTVFPYLGEHGEISGVTGVELHQFQCIQHTVDEIELKLVMDRPLSDEEQEKVAALMQRHFGHPFSIRFTFLEDIPRGLNGKFEEFVSKIA